jgi:hypothetical protein
MLIALFFVPPITVLLSALCIRLSERRTLC